MAAIPGVLMTLSGAADQTFITNEYGIYNFNGLIKGQSYTVTPSKPGYIFTPSSRIYSPITDPITGQSFVGDATTIPEIIFASGDLDASGPKEGSQNWDKSWLPYGCAIQIIKDNDGDGIDAPDKNNFTALPAISVWDPSKVYAYGVVDDQILGTYYVGWGGYTDTNADGRFYFSTAAAGINSLMNGDKVYLRVFNANNTRYW